MIENAIKTSAKNLLGIIKGRFSSSKYPPLLWQEKKGSEIYQSDLVGFGGSPHGNGSVGPLGGHSSQGSEEGSAVGWGPKLGKRRERQAVRGSKRLARPARACQAMPSCVPFPVGVLQKAVHSTIPRRKGGLFDSMGRPRVQ